MNKTLSKIGSYMVVVSVVLFAICMPISEFVSYFVCIFLSIGYLMMIAGYQYEAKEERKVAANIGLLFGCIYAVFIMMVYFAQLTAIKNDVLHEQALLILDYSKGGLFFSYDLFGYGMMALSTFFIGLSMESKEKWLKRLLMIHGIFFFSCLIMPIFDVFSHTTDKIWGIVALECWCIYFLPIGILSILHFKK